MLSLYTAGIGVRHSSRVIPSLFSKSKDFNLSKIGPLAYQRLFYSRLSSYDKWSTPVGMPSEPLTPDHPHFHLFESNLASLEVPGRALTKKEIEKIKLDLKAFQDAQGDLSKDEFIFTLFQRLQGLNNDFQSLKNRVQKLEVSLLEKN